MKSLTPEEKKQKKARDNLRILHSSILSAFSFRKIPDYHTLYKHLGYPQSIIDQHPNKELQFKELKAYLQNQTNELEKSFQSTESLVIQVIPKESEDWIPEKELIRFESDGNVILKREIITELAPVVKEKLKLDSDNNYGLEDSPMEKAFLHWFQKKAAAEICRKTFVERKSGLLLLAPTGVGKTFIVAAALRRALDKCYHEGKTMSHMPYLYVTKSTILEQTHRVFKNYFNIQPNVDVEVINIEGLRATAGQFWVKEEAYIEGGEEKTRWRWKKGIPPVIVALDESQGTKRPQAKQSKIMFQYPELDNTCLWCISASPFMRISEARSFAVSTKRPLEHLGFPKGAVLCNETWNAYAAIMAGSKSKPEDYNEAAVKRLMDDLDDYVVRVRGVKPQFDALNSVKIINFESQEKREFYNNAWERFLIEKAKVEAAQDAGMSTGVCHLVVLLKFAMAAELCHAEGFADTMYQDVQKGYAAVSAVKFKQTLIEIVNILITKYGVSRDKISLIWGGGQTQLTKKQKAKAKIKELKDKLKEAGIESDELLGDMGLEDVEDRVIKDFPPEWRLGLQNARERQSEIDKFQSGETLFCIYTLKAGGVGLSLHHSDELTTKWDESKPGYVEWKAEIDKWNSHRSIEKQVKPGKCRRKESGYVFEEDIPFIPVRPRTNRICVTYNAVELVQGVGRVPRLTSLSPTVQYIYCYNGTIECRMGEVYSKKLRCLSAVVKQKESWQDIIFGGLNTSTALEEALKKSESYLDNESSLIDEGDTDESEEVENGNGN